ncbi:MAG: hypothetical protein HEP71_13075 [Roseivirga sp.]|nr:hypothetical protein [Roseivirga sp.]
MPFFYGAPALVFRAFFGCAPQTDEASVTIDDTITERATYTSDISIGGYSFTKETNLQFTISVQGELLSSEVLPELLMVLKWSKREGDVG